MPNAVQQESIGGKVILGVCIEDFFGGKIGVAGWTLARKLGRLVVGLLFLLGVFTSRW
jgi:hypothetical protein